MQSSVCVFPGVVLEPVVLFCFSVSLWPEVHCRTKATKVAGIPLNKPQVWAAAAERSVRAFFLQGWPLSFSQMGWLHNFVFGATIACRAESGLAKVAEN